MGQNILAELRRDISELKRRNPKVKKNPARLEIICTLEEAAIILGCSRMSLYRYRRMVPGFPTLPAFRISLLQWRRGFLLRKGPQPSQQRKMVVCLREQGLTFSEIARRVKVSRASAFQLWRRHQRRNMLNLTS
jgi:hypothetical protein